MLIIKIRLDYSLVHRANKLMECVYFFLIAMMNIVGQHLSALSRKGKALLFYINFDFFEASFEVCNGKIIEPDCSLCCLSLCFILSR